MVVNFKYRLEQVQNVLQNVTHNVWNEQLFQDVKIFLKEKVTKRK